MSAAPTAQGFRGPHIAKIRVRFSELDPYKHVNHAVYIQYFETARVELLAEVGYSLSALRAAGSSIVVSQIATKFLASAEESDDLTVETEIVEFRRVSSRWRQRILRGNELIASQELRAAMVSIDGSVIRFPAEMVQTLSRFVID